MIETFYRDKGYLAQVILSPKDLQDGVVAVEVLEAKLGAVIVDTDKEGSRCNQQFASHFVTTSNKLGAAIKVDDLERALIHLNKVPGVKATSALEAGEQVGETNLRVTLVDTNLLGGRAKQLYLGASYGIRAYSVAQGGGSQGAMLTVEVQKTPSTSLQPSHFFL